MSFITDLKKSVNLLDRPLTDEELNEFFMFNQTKQLYKVWITTERFQATIKTIKLFAFLLDDYEVLENVYSCIPKDERFREELKKQGISYIDAYDIYRRTDMPFMTLFECLIEIFNKGPLSFWDIHHAHIYNIDGVRSITKILERSEVPYMWDTLKEVENILINPVSLKLEGNSYRYHNPEYGAGYDVNNKVEKYKFSKTHFREATTKNEPKQYLGAELVWNDTGMQVKKYKDNWLEKSPAETFKDLGRYEGNPYWGPYAPSGLSKYIVNQ